MITNDRQYRITKTEAERFRQAIADARAGESNLSPRMHQALIDGLESQLSDLEREIDQYEFIRSGKLEDVGLTSLADLPHILVMARIASHLTQAELAERLGIHEQQVQRYESSFYAGASLSRLIETAEALELSIRGSVHLPKPTTRNEVASPA